MKNTQIKILKYQSIVMAVFLMISCNKQEGPEASGTFEAIETIISSEASGRIIQLNLTEGQELKVNQEVGKIDSVAVYLNKLQLLQTQKAILSAKPGIATQLEALKKELGSAETDVQRIENLTKEGIASSKQLDDAKTRVEVLRSKIDAQLSALNTTANNLDEQANTVDVQLRQVENQLSKCRITNPLNGVVLAKYAETNEMTAPGKALYKIADLSFLNLRAYISGDQLAKVKLNQAVKVFSDDGQGGLKETEGLIVWINTKAEFTPKTILTKNERANLVYAIKVKVKNDGTLKIGMYGEIRF